MTKCKPPGGWGLNWGIQYVLKKVVLGQELNPDNLFESFGIKEIYV